MSIRLVDRRNPFIRGVVAVLCLLLVASGNPVVFAQTPTPQAPPAAAGADAAGKLGNDQLDALVAPIALYPDPLLSQALVASTYPLELMQAQQWLKKNEALKDEALTKAVEQQNWDPSVQATVVIPDLLKRLTEDITWTQNLGNAFLEQPDDVMDAVQRLRTKAKAGGKLESSEQQKVETKVVESQTVIVIQPASTQVVYVPVYSPVVIWGPPIYPYPPMYYPPYRAGVWVGFGVGVAVGIGMSGGWGYGCGWGHGGNNIYINNNNNFHRSTNIRTGNININSGNSNWSHNPSHRGNAPYASTNTANKFGGNTRDSMSSRTGAGNAGANRAGASATSAGANRAGAAASGAGASRAGATSASRPTGGDKVGNRTVPQSSSRSSGFSGASGGASSASRAKSTSSRGGASMGCGAAEEIAMMKDMTMTTRTTSHHRIRSVAAAAAVALAMASFGASHPSAIQAPASPQGPRTFPSPEAAVQAAIEAAASGTTALLALLGPDGKDIVASGDAVQDQKDRADFVRLAREKTRIAKDPANPGRATLLVGNDEFPGAIPLVQKNGVWMWDAVEGRYELLIRRIGENELDTIAVCRGYVEAQLDYAALDPDKTGVHQYAQRVISTPGKHDGLYWPAEPGGPESPIGENIARAIAEGYTSKTQPYHGYYYKVLTAQGPSAPLGAMDFMVQGHMIGGFALVAWPANYRVTGVKTFIVGASGIVYERDLGVDTAKIAAAMTVFDPDKTWVVTNDGK